MKANIAVLPGDGIGPEVTQAGVEVLKRVAELFGHAFSFSEAAIGGSAIDQCGDPLPAATLALCEQSDAILLGAVGGPKWSDPNARVRPEQGLLKLRQTLGLYANLRPVKPIEALLDFGPIKPERLRGVDLLVVRELTGGIYFGERTRTATSASDLCTYTVAEIERVTRVAGHAAMARRRHITSIDKANVLETSRLWRSTVERLLTEEFPQVRFEHQLVDSAAMHLIARPASFDVILTENLFGDILTDEASMLAASLGMLPSASMGASGPGLFEPIHGSAPDIAGRKIANPIGTILSTAMLLRLGLKLEAEALAVEQAVDRALKLGLRTADLSGAHSTEDATAMIISCLHAHRPSKTEESCA